MGDSAKVSSKGFGNWAVCLALLACTAVAVHFAIATPAFNYGDPVSQSPESLSGTNDEGLIAKPNLDGLAPDLLLVVLKDLEGFTSDCGCSSQTPGWLGRLATLVDEWKPQRVYFLGSTFSMNRTSSMTDSGWEAHQKQVYALLPVSIAAIGGVGEVVVDMTSDGRDLQEAAKAAARQLDRHLAIWTDSASRSTFPEQLDVQNGAVSLAGTSLLPMHELGARAREVCFVAVWNVDSIADSVVVDQRLGSAFRMARLNPSLKGKLADLVQEVKGCRVSYWKHGLHSEIQPAGRIEEMLRNEAMALAHGGLGGPDLPLVLDKQGVLDGWRDCASCHPKAFESWERSPHSRAYETLLKKGRHEDTKCLTCHVQSFEFQNKRTTVPKHHAAVTCNSCHSRLEEATSVEAMCQQCHTATADPKGSFRKALTTICGGGTTNHGECTIR